MNADVRRSLDHKRRRVLQQQDSAQMLEFIMMRPTLIFGMVCDVVSCFQDKAHELCHVKGVVCKLWMVPEGWVVTLREVRDNSMCIRSERRQ